MKVLLLTVLFAVVLVRAGGGQTGLAGRPGVIMENASSVVVFDFGGGALADFHLKSANLNPFTWNHPAPGDLKPRQLGHFICFDRWGPASKAEIVNGMPQHGEASTTMWKLDSPPVASGGAVTASMSCAIPLAGMTLKRTMTLDTEAAVMLIREQFTNTNKLGRIYNVVQHGTVGQPFLDETMLIDTVVEKGFAHKEKTLLPEEPVLYWPKAVYNGSLVDFRTLSAANPGPGVVCFALAQDAEYGWVTACNPGKGLLVGYVWKRTDYPWMNMWRNVQNGKPFSFGMEFGSTGFHQPYPVLVNKGSIWGRPLYSYIDAGETQERSYIVFLTAIPAGFKGVSSLTVEHGKIVLAEQGTAPRTVTVTARVLP